MTLIARFIVPFIAFAKTCVILNGVRNMRVKHSVYSVVKMGYSAYHNLATS